MSWSFYKSGRKADILVALDIMQSDQDPETRVPAVAAIRASVETYREGDVVDVQASGSGYYAPDGGPNERQCVSVKVVLVSADG